MGGAVDIDAWPGVEVSSSHLCFLSSDEGDHVVLMQTSKNDIQTFHDNDR